MNEQKDNPILVKTFKFALKTVGLVREIQSEKKEFVLTKQLLRSGTSIGANAEEAIGRISKKDFVHKLTISYKEARETKYWLRLLKESRLLEEKIAIELLSDCEEILKILFSIIRTSRN
ncbi:MAG: four helix bundle protein [Crocinitomicaceae bacterium]